MKKVNKFQFFMRSALIVLYIAALSNVVTGQTQTTKFDRAMHFIRTGQHINPCVPLSDDSEYKKSITRLMDAYKETSSLINSEEKVYLPDDMYKFYALFPETKHKILHNDMIPDEYSGPKTLTPNEYVNFAKKRYADALDVLFEVKEITVEKKCERGSYLAIVKAHKETRGFYLNKKLHGEIATNYLYVLASANDTLFEKAKIIAITNEKGYNKLEANRKIAGMFVGFSYNNNQSTLYNKNSFTDSIWSSKFASKSTLSFDVYYMLTKGLGLGIGFQKGKYGNTLTTNNASFPDVGYSNHSISQSFNIETIDIPIMLKFRTGHRIVGMIWDVGIVYSQVKKATINIEGKFNNSEVQTISGDYTWDSPSSLLSARTALGLSVLVYKNITIRAAINASYGLTDLGYKTPVSPADYIATRSDIAYNSNVIAAGFEIGVHYRIIPWKRHILKLQ